MKFLVVTVVSLGLISESIPIKAAEITGCISIDPINETTESKYVSFSDNIEFSELEKIINSNLSIQNNKYVYTNEQKQTILTAIDDFDITNFNEETNNSFTNESLKSLIMSRIDNADLTVKSLELSGTTRSRYCNRVYTEGGWNYTRYWTNQSGTIQWADELSSRALLDTGIGFGASFFGPGGVACAVAFTVHGLYCSSLAGELLKKETGCGVRTDINSFYAAYDVKDQKTL